MKLTNTFYYVLLGEPVVVAYEDSSSSADIQVLEIKEVLHRGLNILEKVKNTKHLSHIVRAAEFFSKEVGMIIPLLTEPAK